MCTAGTTRTEKLEAMFFIKKYQNLKMEEEENQNKKIEKEVKKEAKKIQNGELKSLKHFFSTKKTKSKSGGRRKSKIK